MAGTAPPPLPPIAASGGATTQSVVPGLNAAQLALQVWVPRYFGSSQMVKMSIGDYLTKYLKPENLMNYTEALVNAGYLSSNPGPSGYYDPASVMTGLGKALLQANFSNTNISTLLAQADSQNQAASAAAGAPPPSRFFKGGAVTVGITTPGEVQTSGDNVAQQLVGRHLTADQVAKITGILNTQEYAKGEADVATAQANQAAYAEAFQGGQTGGATGGGGAAGAGAVPGQTATANAHDLAQLAYNAGFRGQALTNAVAVALAESEGNTTALNNTPSTGDYSVGAWQVNYYGDLLAPRTAKYGAPAALQNNPQGQAAAAFDISGGGKDFSAWTTYTSGKYKQYLGQAQAAAGSIKGSAPVSVGGLANAQGVPSDIAKPSATPAPAPVAPPAAPAGTPQKAPDGTALNPLPTLPTLAPGQSGSLTVGGPSSFQTQTATGYPVTDTVLPPTATIVANPESPEQATADFLMNHDSAQYQVENLSNVFAALNKLMTTNTGAARGAGTPVEMAGK